MFKKAKEILQEIRKIIDYEIEDYSFEKFEDNIIIALKLKDFPKDKNMVEYEVYLMNQLYDKQIINDDVDIYISLA